MKRSLTILLLICLLPKPRVAGQEVNHWETMVTFGSVCRFLVPASQPDPSWILPDFNDASWNTGPGGVGYGDGDDQTIIDPAISVYCRYSFEVTNTADIVQLLLDVDFDDGFVAYLNGQEIARYLLGPEGSSPPWDRPAGIRETCPCGFPWTSPESRSSKQVRTSWPSKSTTSPPVLPIFPPMYIFMQGSALTRAITAPLHTGLFPLSGTTAPCFR